MGDEQSTRLMRMPKEGERILAPTRRPDGTLRKPIRIRAGYTPQDEVAIYQSKGTLMRKAAESLVPPGYDPALDAKLKTKSEKRNERKKEKKLRAALAEADKGKNLDLDEAVDRIADEASAAYHDRQAAVESVTAGITNISISLSKETLDSSKYEDCSGTDVDKRIRALKKKIRLAEGQLKGDQLNMKPEQIEKLSKIGAWHEELKLLEEKRTNLPT
ncbi:partner of Y14 and mago isoform X2 [Phalaenopsis equestris]|uniref:partner of Y14 and mago isoform X2 n=1 Tax=Phalaenopsis equestris TaxID=78828 RepID=UPI0009E238A2|nr:partner of Y14 and mago isoform X2 [Phalaenopsis equestris]